ncbi:unnamed protein product, partial [Diatraea saccharalis]
ANTCLEKDDFYEFAKPWLGEGLVTGKGKNNRNNRAFLAPPTVCAFVFLVTALGVDFGDHTLLNSKYVQATEEILYTMVDRFQKFWLHSSSTFKWSEVKRTQDRCLKILHNMSNTVILRIKFKPFMDLLLELSIEKGVFNDREIREHVDTMIVGGHDTSANVLMFTLLLLGSHPEAQEKAFRRIEEVFGGSDRDVEKQDISKLVYLEAVLKESIRMYTIVPVLARKLDRNVSLSKIIFSEKYTLAAGRTCFMFLFGIHKHPMWGPDADQFNPDRWLSPDTLPDNQNCFVGFSLGRRMCIGKH